MNDRHYAPNAINKMGLGIDEILDASINFSRKNYADWFPEKPFPADVKLVGNTVKSKKMPEYIAKFLSKGIRMLLSNDGKGFLDEYYKMLDDIYNFRIPLKDIASKGKVKKSIAEYIEDCKTVTAAGTAKSRQAWMELALKENLNINLGDTLYYINTGSGKGQSDVKRITHYYKGTSGIFGDRNEVTKQIDKDWKAYNKEHPKGTEGNLKNKAAFIAKFYADAIKEDEIILNCALIPTDIIESETDVFCDESNLYNQEKYIEQFNKRITPLLVCFSKDIRDRILIKNPSERPYFTDEECKLVNGQPNKPGDQDTYEQLMTMEDKEIRFWMAHPEFDIPYLEECGMNWEEIKGDYLRRMEEEKEKGIDVIKQKFNEYIEKMSQDDFDAFIEGEIPASLTDSIMLDPLSNNFVSVKYPDMVIGTIHDILDRNEVETNDENEYDIAF